MSEYAQARESERFTAEQNRLILSGTLNNIQLSKRFGRCIRQIQRQRALLKKLGAVNE